MTDLVRPLGEKIQQLREGGTTETTKLTKSDSLVLPPVRDKPGVFLCGNKKGI